MRILVFSVLSLQLLESLADYLAKNGNDVIGLTGKRTHPLPGIRRIIMNFEGKARQTGATPVEIWKEALKNGANGKKALENLSSSWKPDLILASSSHGGAFFIRDVFEDAWLAAFASSPDAYKITVELDCRLFLESQICYAQSSQAIGNFPPLIRPGLRPEPVCIDTEFFCPGKGGNFSCWKVNASDYGIVTLALGGLSAASIGAWSNTMARFLAMNKACAIVALMDSREMGGRLLAALKSLPGKLDERLFISGAPEKNIWRNLCVSCKCAIFTHLSQKRLALECLASGGNACATEKSGLLDLPGIRRLPREQPSPKQIAGLMAESGDANVWEEIRQKYGCETVIPTFASEIIAEFEASRAG